MESDRAERAKGDERRRTSRRAIVVVAMACAIASPSLAFAADAGSNDAEVDDLLKSIRHDADTLSTDDCISACKALDSMRRATGKLCSLDAGRRCSEARAKLDDATRRVRAACPTCALPGEEAPTQPGTAAAPPPAKASPRDSEPASATQESRRGGCLGCGGGSSSSQGATTLLGVLAFLFVRRRR